tara:strand:+ start:135 stop:551 length:417 start_codon:yes stop_codon:yes gene_type:complete
MSNTTLTMIKPEAVEAGNSGAILKIIESAGFRIIAMKKTKLSPDLASTFYEVHKEKPFFKELIDYMSSGPIIAAILEKDNAVTEFRKLIGATNPKDAEEGTIRAIFAESLSKNAIHGSDSDENAQVESDFHFKFEERY